jgi:hypothetical protein
MQALLLNQRKEIQRTFLLSIAHSHKYAVTKKENSIVLSRVEMENIFQ